MRSKILPRLVLILALLGLASSACSTPAPTAPPTQTPAPAPTATQPVKGACGDGVCDGPENAQICPQDCDQAAAPPFSDTPPPDARPRDLPGAFAKTATEVDQPPRRITEYRTGVEPQAHAEKLLPQPHEAVALGLLNAKPLPITSSLKSMVVPLR